MDMAANYDIRLNTYTGGIYCFFEHRGEEFCADLSTIPFAFGYSSECMIFPAKNGKVEKYEDLYCNRDVRVTDNDLIDCIEEFKILLDRAQGEWDD